MKKLLALIIIFLMLPASKVLAADTSPTDSSTEKIGENINGESKQEDSLQKMYDSFRNMDEEEWIDHMGNKDLYGHNKADDGAFELTGLMNELFFDVKDMLPGDTITKYIRIYNTSGKDYTLSYDAYRSKEQMPKEGEIDLLDVIDLEITKSGDKLEEPVFKGKIFDEYTNNRVIKLGTIKSSQKSSQEAVIFKATVTMDPNAGEEYKNKEAEISWIFKAEGDDESDDPTDKPKDPENPSQNPSKPSLNPLDPSIHTVDLNSYSDKGQYKGTVSKTGDNNYLIIYGLLAVGSLMIGYVLFSKGKKNRKEQ